MDDVFKEFETTEQFNALRGDSRVEAIFVSGSRAVGVTDGHSDYDLVCLVGDMADVGGLPSERLTISGQSLHWFFLDKDGFERGASPVNWNFRFTGGLQSSFAYGREPLYVKNGGTDYEKLCSERLDLVLSAASRSLDSCKEIFNLAEKGLLVATKINYYILLAYYFMKGMDPKEDAGFLTEVKRMRWQNISEPTANRLRQTLKEFPSLVKKTAK